jgi:hypothetical protein
LWEACVYLRGVDLGTVRLALLSLGAFFGDP